MTYRVKFMEDDLMPLGRDWAICIDDEGHDLTVLHPGEEIVTLCIRKSTRDNADAEVEAMLEAAWEAYRDLVAEEEGSRPLLRVV